MRRVRRNHWCGGLLAGAIALTFLMEGTAAAASVRDLGLINADTGELKLKAEAGDPAAQEAYARRLEAGHYHVTAAKWHRRAAEAGRAESQYRLGSMLLKGRPGMGAERPVLPAQPLAAIHWLRQAALQDHTLAQLALGQCYHNGTGTAENPVEAYKWFLLAADKSIHARNDRDRAALKLSAEQIQKARRQAEAFRSGDRSDPRIRIVTLAEQQAVEAPLAVEAGAQRSVDEAGLVTEAIEPPLASAKMVLPTQATNIARPVASSPLNNWLSGLRPKSEGATGLANVPRWIMWAVAFAGMMAMGLVAIVVAVAQAHRRRKPRQDDVAKASEAAAPPIGQTRAGQPRPATTLERLRGIDWFQFERLMELIFTRKGYQTSRRGGAHPDGGIDLELMRGGTRTAVQCKHWKNQQVGIKEVREFLGALTAGGFEQGIFVTISNYTAAALEFARQNRIEIMDGAHVLALLERHEVNCDPELVAALNQADKRCPKCESRLVQRQAQKGSRAGGLFWGCSTYPRCCFVMEA